MTKRVLIDQNDIRSWIIENGGTPAVIKVVDEGEEGQSPDMLHISFDPMESNFEEISWSEFFDRFDSENLALVIHDDEVEPPDFGLVDREFAIIGDEQTFDTELPDSGDEHELKENKFASEPPEGEPDI